MKTKIRVKMKPVNRILSRLGVTPDDDVQAHLTADINHRITRYMPFRSSALSTKTKFLVDNRDGVEHMSEDGKRIISSTEIFVQGPYARYQYYGKLMVDPVTGSAWARSKQPKVLAKPPKALKYDKSKNPEAGPKWDKRLMAAEGAQIAADLQKYIERRKHR